MLSAAVRRLSPLQWAGVGLGSCAVLLALLGLLAPASAFFFPLLSLWASVGLFVLALCVLRVAGAELGFFHKAVVFGIWAVAVVYFYWTLSSRSFVYVWDYANYLLKQYDAEAAFAQSAGAGLAYIFGSMADDYTNFITLFTEFPFCLTSHTGDDYSFSQVFCILPTLLVLLAGLVVKVGQILNVKNRRYYFLFGMTLTAAYPFLRMSAVLAQPDWFGLIFAFAILLLTLDLRFDKLEPVRFGLIFLATAAIILARRWFLYFVVGYYFAYALLLIAGCVRLAKGGEKAAALVRIKNLVLFGLASVVAMVILLWPMVSHILAYNYAGRYSYYNGGGAGGFDFSGMDMGDIFGDIFGDFFGGGRRNSNNNGPAQGASVRLTVRITFEEAVFGCSKELEFPYKEECKTCHGTGAKPGTSPETCSKCGGKGKVVYSQQSLFGMMQNVQTCPDCGGTGKVIREKCPDCRGTGYISKKVRKTVEIPAGIDNGQSVRVRGYGEPGRNGGPRGDLLVEVLVSRSNAFERQDMNIFSNASISFGIAALGGDIRIRTVDGDIIYTVAPGTQSGTRIRLKGKGVPSIRNKAVRGDHYVTLIVNTPTGLNKEAKEALRKFDELTGNSLNKEGGAQTGKEKKKGFMDKIKESFDEH